MDIQLLYWADKVRKCRVIKNLFIELFTKLYAKKNLIFKREKNGTFQFLSTTCSTFFQEYNELEIEN